MRTLQQAARMKLARYAAAFLTLFLLLTGCSDNVPVHNSRFVAFGTLVDLSIVGKPNDQAQRVSDAVQQDFAQMQETWHAWEESPLTRTNELLQQGEVFAVAPSILPLLKASQPLAEKSDYLFDPAIGRLIKLWGFQSDIPDCKHPPPRESILALLEDAPRLSDITIDGIHLHTDNTLVKLDFGAIGKGFGIDMAIERIQSMGVSNAIINAGGDLRAIGSRHGQPWRIAIRSPSGGGVFGFIEIEGDESIFTSGDYERNFTWEGKVYHHIIDPRTGYPAEGTKSVTVIHTDATTADAAATALFVAGPNDWHRIASQMGIKHVLLVDQQGIVHMNPAMEKRVSFLSQPTKIKISPPL